MRCFPATDKVIGGILTVYVKQNVNAIILESYGVGNFPVGHTPSFRDSLIYQSLKTAVDKNILLVNCSQVLTAKVNSSYAAGSWLTDFQVISTKDMTAITTFVKLLYLITLKNYRQKNWSHDMIKLLMLKDFRGEITSD